MNEKFCISIRISLKFIPKGPIGNKPAMVPEMVWHRVGDKPLPEPVLTMSTNAYMRHQGKMNIGNGEMICCLYPVELN